MSEIRLKKQINELRSSLFDKKNSEDKKELQPANVNSKEKPKATGIFNDVRSMDNRLAKLEETFYNYAYDSTKILTSFHRNTKILEKLINEITEKNEISGAPEGENPEKVTKKEEDQDQKIYGNVREKAISEEK